MDPKKITSLFILRQASQGSDILYQAAKHISSFLLRDWKQYPHKLIEHNPVTYRRSQYFQGFEKFHYFPRLGDLHIEVLRADLDGSLFEPERAGYMPKLQKFREPKLGGKKPTFDPGRLIRGDWFITIVLDSSVKSFSDVKKEYGSIIISLIPPIIHELIHYFDDVAGKIFERAEDMVPYLYGVSDNQGDLFNNDYFPDDETRAYVTEIMATAKLQKTTFLEELKDWARRRPGFSAQRNNPKVRDLIKMLEYKCLSYASGKYNVVREDPAAQKYLNDLDRYLLDRGIHVDTVI